MIRHAHDDWTVAQTPSDRMVVRIAAFFGSFQSLAIHLCMWSLWITTGLFRADGYPFLMLTLFVSMEGVFQNIIITMSQRIADKAARVQRDADYEARIQADLHLLEIKQLIAKVASYHERRG